MKLSNILYEQDIDNEVNIIKTISLENLVVNRDSLFEAYIACLYKNKCSKTNKPINVYEIEDEPEKYQLYDGYHRLIEYLIDQNHKKNKNMIAAEINNSFSIKEYWAIAPKNKRWQYIGSKKYGNLEDLTSKSTLDDHVKKRKNKKIENIFEILFESEDTDLIDITGYHRNDNPDFKISDITMNPRITRQSKRNQEDKIGFYITMPRIKISSTEDIPNELITAPDTGQHYGEFLYKIKIAVPRDQIFLNTYILGSTRISPKDIAEKYDNKKFIYVPNGFPTAEGIVLDTDIIKSIEPIFKSTHI